MTSFSGWTCALAVFLILHSGIDAAAQEALKVPVTGTAAKHGTFTGTVAVTQFETRGNELVAIGVVSGTVTHRNRSSNRALGTVFVRQLAIPVSVRAGNIAPASGRPGRQHGLQRVSFVPAGRLERVQDAECSVIDIVLGPFTVNVEGVDTTIDPVVIQLSGEPGTPVGDLVCQVNELIGNVAGLVGVVNTILNVLILLLGGGLVIPTPGV